jgi:alpha-tubulin suppressor-like RCC1 family protein
VGLDPARQVSSVVPVQVPLPSVKRAGTGAHHSCAVTADGSLWCWGSNHSGQLGGAFRGSGPEPHRVPIACD